MTRTRWLLVARVAFLVAAAGFALWGLRGQGPEILAALTTVPPGAAVLATVLVLAGLLLTSVVWRDVLAGYGHRPPHRAARSVFFVGQLGKYIPGSVWSLGAQAEMATRYQVPARTTVATGLVFLGFNVATAAWLALPLPLVAGGAIAPVGWWWGFVGLAAVAGTAFLVPAVTDRVGRLLAGAPLTTGWPRACRAVGLMLLTWLLYGLATRLVFPGEPQQPPTATVLWATSAFCLSYVVGVLVVFAPAGLGAREVLLAWLLAPLLGVPGAAAVAILTRVIHTAADFALAGAAWLWFRLRPPD